ncbi:MAG: single-stranded-DNA-specific exonuclease RecJ [Candidatus Omnitrophica bacterium]|nr:single-stranded-DNA-specific exonuclease RecJ [Candidatus Omnitrophota bacterium]
MKPHWTLLPQASGASRIAAQLGIHPAIASILLRRGVRTPSEISDFLNPALELLQDPFVFQDMEKAVRRIRRAVADREKILVYGDYDVDGVTGSAILCPALKRMGADVEAHIPHRIEEGYGLNLGTLARFAEKKLGLVITVDNGITGIEPIRFLVSKGIDVIIVDHHAPKGEIPPAYAILSAAVGEKKGDPNLAACGVAFKLAWALLGSLEAVRHTLDLVALGTVADLAPVRGDNRTLLKHGLPALSRTQRPGLVALMKVARISRRHVSYRDIAFGLAPRINASGRMGSPLHAFELLTTDSEEAAARLAKFLDEGNRERQRVEAAAFEQAAEEVRTNFADPGENRVLVLHHSEWHEGVLGIVAARLVERFQRPSIVIAMKDQIGKGSGRSLPHFSLFDCVLSCEDLLENFGGHAQACGLTIRGENVEEFRRRINRSALEADALGGIPALEIDGELAPGEIDLKFLKDLERLAPFGPGNKKPLFLSKGLRMKGPPARRGKDTLVCWMTDENGQNTCEVVGFRAFGRWNGSPQNRYDVVHRPSLREFDGIASIQLELEDWA